MRNIKKSTFCWQDKQVLNLIKQKFKKSELSNALSLYLTLTEQASYF